MQKNLHLPSLLGTIVFLSRVDEKGNADYKSGHYIVTGWGPSVIQAVAYRPHDGYHSHECYTFAIKGPNKFSISDIRFDLDKVEAHAKWLNQYGNDGLMRSQHNQKVEWCSNVYSSCVGNSATLLEIVNDLRAFDDLLSYLESF